MLTSSDNASAFENDWRYKQSLLGRPIADKLYRQTFGPKIAIERTDRYEQKVLDIQFAIDLQITFPCGFILLGQEKFLSAEQAKYKTLTVEFMQDPKTGEGGDWFKLAAQFYFCGYFTRDQKDFDPWVLVNWPAVVLATHTGQIKWGERQNMDGRARASFRFCYIHALPVACIIASSREPIRLLPLQPRLTLWQT